MPPTPTHQQVKHSKLQKLQKLGLLSLPLIGFLQKVRNVWIEKQILILSSWETISG